MEIVCLIYLTVEKLFIKVEGELIVKNLILMLKMKSICILQPSSGKLNNILQRNAKLAKVWYLQPCARI